jgi:hypothetical protein
VLTILVVGSAVAGAHEKFGLLKPADWAAEVGTINGKNLEIIAFDASHPARNVGSRAIPGTAYGIFVIAEAGLAFGEFLDGSEAHPIELMGF